MKDSKTPCFLEPLSFSKSLIPQGIELFSCHFNLSHYHFDLFKKYNVLCPESIQRAVPKRQAEYLAGRYCAIKSLALLGEPAVDITIGQHRNPIWPDGICASITHTHSQAISVATFSKNYQYLGIDLENKLSQETVLQIKSSIINSAEEKILNGTALPFEDMFTVVFSAKESLFKALYPKVGAYFDFSAAKVIDVCFRSNSICLQLCEDLSSQLISGKTFTVYFSITETSIFSIVYM